jgi:hypothetical protein
MKVSIGKQLEKVSDAVQAKFAMTVPILRAILFSLHKDRIARLGGIDKVTLWDLAREFREGSGDAGICFEYAIHEAIATKNPLIWPLTAEVLEDFCELKGGADSILFGPEKEGKVPILQTAEQSLTEDSRVYAGTVGQPTKLKKHLKELIRAHRDKDPSKLPRSIKGLWKADLFLGTKAADGWVGTSVKINSTDLIGAEGLRIGIYPKKREDKKDVPRKDETLNLIRLPLPYDQAFMEAFYRAFFLVRAFLMADAKVPPPVDLPDPEDQFVTKELQRRRDFTVLEVLASIENVLAQRGLLKTQESDVKISATFSTQSGTVAGAGDMPPTSETISVAPEPSAE